MNRRTAMTVGLALAASAPGALGQHAALRAVPFTQVTIEDGFWSPRLQTNREKTLWANFRQCEQTGRIANFDRASGRAAGDFEGYFFNDSDVYKAIEGASLILANHPDPKLDQYLDDLIDRIAAAQRPDGYLNSYFSVKGLDKRWTNLKDMHELYCAGHLIEAGVAHHRATGKRTLLDVAIRLADHIDATFGLAEGKTRNVCGHEEIELALVKLADETGREKYRDLAAFFVAERGRAHGRTLFGEYAQDHRPVEEHDQIVGHAVRAMYLYCAAADLAAATGDRAYVPAMLRVWDDLVHRKTYITGGIGQSSHNEGFTVPYDLPNDTAYAESCAGIGSVLWNHRLNLLLGHARYADAMERALYNGVLSSVSLDGERFFYVNPLASRGTHHRQEWFACACCPPNILRLLAQLPGMVYAQTDSALYVNLYAGGSASVTIAGTQVTVMQETSYPWDGTVRLTFTGGAPAGFDLYLRIPAWCDEPSVRIAGVEYPVIVQNGYAWLNQEWKPGVTVELRLPMRVRRIAANPEVAANRGRVALQRGPVVYCLEGTDHPGVSVRTLAVSRDAELWSEHRSDLLGGVTVIKGSAVAAPFESWDDGALYRPVADAEAVELTAVPYYAWDNREAGEMVVWLPESVRDAEPPLEPGVKASASHCFERDTVAALYDRHEPRHSADQSQPRFTWWPRKGSTEWAQLEFDEPRAVTGVDVYWFDDEPLGGGCRVPASWRVFGKAGDQWVPIPGATPGDVRKDAYNTVTWPRVLTSGVRVEATLQDGHSAGILEMRVRR